MPKYQQQQQQQKSLLQAISYDYSKDTINIIVLCFIGDDVLYSSPGIPISIWNHFKYVTEGISPHLHILRMTV